MIDIKKKLEKLHLLEEAKRLREGLPYLYGMKHYPWSREFFESRNKMCLLTAANQIGKSTVQIRKVLYWATAQELWPSLWRTKPVMFWYLYPTRDMATLEFDTKWEFMLPQGEFKNDPVYGWEVERDRSGVKQLIFNNGVIIVFKTYAQDTQALQAGTCHYIACDEELPQELYDELKFRIAATNGYFSMVFTATLGQEFWREAMEERGEKERFPHAAKWQISTYDCMEFEDFTKSHWTLERVQEMISLCSTESEVQKRIFGKFVMTEGRKYSSFSPKQNSKVCGELPKDWYISVGVDHGSGGERGHPAAIALTAISPDFKRGRCIEIWRGDKIVTTPTDTLNKYMELRNKWEDKGYRFSNAWYDWGSKDLYNIALQMNITLLPAEKSHERGEGVLNTLFKNELLELDLQCEEMYKLVNELSGLRKDQAKNKAKDDACDALRYSVTQIPWNLEGLVPKEREIVTEKIDSELERRRHRDEGSGFTENTDSIEEEFEEWNEQYS